MQKYFTSIFTDKIVCDLSQYKNKKYEMKC